MKFSNWKCLCNKPISPLLKTTVDCKKSFALANKAECPLFFLFSQIPEEGEKNGRLIAVLPFLSSFSSFLLIYNSSSNLCAFFKKVFCDIQTDPTHKSHYKKNYFFTVARCCRSAREGGNKKRNFPLIFWQFFFPSLSFRGLEKFLPNFFIFDITQFFLISYGKLFSERWLK